MSKISELRSIVDNGWTIANRKAVTSRIGKSNFHKLATLARKSDIPVNCFEYSIVKDELKPNKVMELKDWLICQIKGIDQTWRRKINLGDGNMNSEYYGTFKEMHSGMNTFPTTEERIARRALFDKLEPLGCDKIHYRGETYSTQKKEELEHFNKLKNLKVGDRYEPKTNIWISDSSEYAHNRYGNSNNSDVKNVRYTILANEDSKIIEALYGRYADDFFTEGIYDDRAIFEVCKRKFDGKTLEVWLKHIN